MAAGLEEIAWPAAPYISLRSFSFFWPCSSLKHYFSSCSFPACRGLWKSVLPRAWSLAPLRAARTSLTRLGKLEAEIEASTRSSQRKPAVSSGGAQCVRREDGRDVPESRLEQNLGLVSSSHSTRVSEVAMSRFLGHVEVAQSSEAFGGETHLQN